jgi:hypothetical protein
VTIDPIRELRDHLDEHGAHDVEHLLASAWDCFDGSADSAMAAYKLGRVEAPTWDPPILTFRIERHGGTVLGSTRAELQLWTVDLDARTADSTPIGRRQLRPMNKRLDVRPLATEIAELIAARAADPRIRWYGAEARPILARILPEEVGGVPRQTLNRRRRRLRDALRDELASRGWHPTANGRYVRHKT